ncbi:MAG: pilin [Candidatus Saccharibacteria bacterium]|nr:pilin [Candidatus Saccharibacteria bacterium]
MIDNIIVRFAQLKNCVDGVSETDRAGESTTKCNTNLPEIGASTDTLERVLPVVFGTITALAVLIIVVQGIKFILSQGEPDKSAQARKGVIYAAVGLVIVFVADIFVAFILKRFL